MALVGESSHFESETRGTCCRRLYICYNASIRSIPNFKTEHRNVIVHYGQAIESTPIPDVGVLHKSGIKIEYGCSKAGGQSASNCPECSTAIRMACADMLLTLFTLGLWSIIGILLLPFTYMCCPPTKTKVIGITQAAAENHSAINYRRSAVYSRNMVSGKLEYTYNGRALVLYNYDPLLDQQVQQVSHEDSYIHDVAVMQIYVMINNIDKNLSNVMPNNETAKRFNSISSLFTCNTLINMGLVNNNSWQNLDLVFAPENRKIWQPCQIMTSAELWTYGARKYYRFIPIVIGNTTYNIMEIERYKTDSNEPLTALPPGVYVVK
jgi:hypothetical protein